MDATKWEKPWCDPGMMLEFLQEKVSKRKLQLFACACCRRILHLIEKESYEVALETLEQVADRQAPQVRLKAFRGPVPSQAINSAYYAAQAVRQAVKERSWDWIAARGAACDSGEAVWAAALSSAAGGTDLEARRLASKAKKTEHAAQAELVRCIFGNPFRPATLDPTWQTSAVVSLAQAIYNDYAFERLPLLADALEDAGCHHEDILAHCRGPGPHVRGCWVVDLLLEKS